MASQQQQLGSLSVYFGEHNTIILLGRTHLSIPGIFINIWDLLDACSLGRCCMRTVERPTAFRFSNLALRQTFASTCCFYSLCEHPLQEKCLPRRVEGESDVFHAKRYVSIFYLPLPPRKVGGTRLCPSCSNLAREESEFMPPPGR